MIPEIRSEKMESVMRGTTRAIIHSSVEKLHDIGIIIIRYCRSLSFFTYFHMHEGRLLPGCRLKNRGALTMTTDKKITTHLWYDREAKQAAEFYVSVFENSKVNETVVLENTPSGSVDVVNADILGENFTLISAGDIFTFNPSISFIVNYDPSRAKDAKTNIDRAWKKLTRDGRVLMPLEEYPWSKRYGWVQDAYGLSWQLILTDPEGDERPQVVPCLLFANEVYGKAEEAVNFYLSVFEDHKEGSVMHYGEGQEPNRPGTVMFADFKLANLWFAAMDGADGRDYRFNEAVSFIVHCENQDEIDYYWGKLSAVPEAEQCGWLKDKYGVSWQIVPAVMDEMMRSGDKKRIARVTEAFLKMKKFDIAELTKAYAGSGA